MTELESDITMDPTNIQPSSALSEASVEVPSEEPAIEEYETEEEIETGPGFLGTIIPAAIVGLFLGWSFKAELEWCWTFWSSDPNYSHGYLVIPVAVWILWQRLRQPGPRTSRPWHVGWALLLALLAIRVYLHEGGFQWSAAVSLLPVLAALALTFGGLTFLRRSWPALAYLLFLLPLPTRLNGILAQPLQNLATSMSVTLLKMSGLWVLAEGNVIYVGKQPIMVAEACNGLSMMMTLAATVAMAAFVLSMSTWKRVILGLSVAPIALISNVLRITATAWCVHWFGAEIGGKRAHDAAGWLMMPLAFVLVLIELQLLSWLVVEEVVVNEPLLLGRPITPNRGDRARFQAPKPVSDVGSGSPQPDGSGSLPASKEFVDGQEGV